MARVSRVGLCAGRSLVGNPGALLLRSRRHISTFLPTLPRTGFASRPFHDRFGPDHIGTMRALTPAGLAQTRQVSPLPSHCRPSIPTPTTSCASISLWPSHQRIEIGHLAQASPCSSRLAASRRRKRVRHPTGCSFASDCSPPRLAADAVIFGYLGRDLPWAGLPPT